MKLQRGTCALGLGAPRGLSPGGLTGPSISRARAAPSHPPRRSRKPTAWPWHQPQPQAAMVLSWLLLLVTAAPRGAAGAKECYFCELTDSAVCPGIRMHCGDDEDCFTGHGAAPGAVPVLSKGCMRSTQCGHQEPVSYMGVTYSLSTTCCYSHLCNGVASPSGSAAGALGVLLLLLLRHRL